MLDDPVVALAGDRFVIRDETNSRTLGGGIVLNPLGRRVRKPLEAYRANLRMLKDSSGADAIEALINLQESFALGASRVATLMNIPIAEADAALREAPRFVKLSIGDEEGFHDADQMGRAETLRARRASRSITSASRCHRVSRWKRCARGCRMRSARAHFVR